MSIWIKISSLIATLAKKGEQLSNIFAKLKTPPEKTAGFTIAVIALSAKMAKADGIVKPLVQLTATLTTLPAAKALVEFVKATLKTPVGKGNVAEKPVASNAKPGSGVITRAFEDGKVPPETTSPGSSNVVTVFIV